jgi:6-phosphogluconate dehydrogenase
MLYQGCDIGLVGLGVMGRNLALNLDDQGIQVAVYNRTPETTRDFLAKEACGRHLKAAWELREFIGHLHRPRALLLMVKAGPPVDQMLRDLLPFLEAGDLVIDGGNSHFTDTARRERALSKKGLLYLGLGVSGGAKGARFGPSLMPGGSRKGYDRVEPFLTAIAAKVNGEPCVTYLGAGAAGHYVKMVHNGIEYALMQLLAESYDLLKRGLGFTASELAEVYGRWQTGRLNSFLLEIACRIFQRQDELTGQPLVELITDAARAKGTGKWSSWDAMDLMVPTPTIDVAVTMRDLSSRREERREIARLLGAPEPQPQVDREDFLRQLENALYGAMVVSYAQGFAQIRQASLAYNFGVNLEAVARVWRGGCIIRAAMLEEMRAALQLRSDLPNLLLDSRLGEAVRATQADWRNVVHHAVAWGLPAPAFMVSLAYYDACRSPWLPANLIQAQRDFFGAHTYERLDRPGTFHTDWEAGD